MLFKIILLFLMVINVSFCDNIIYNGTICGRLQRVFCGGTSTRLNCPNGYSRSSSYICYKDDAMAEDASGTFCGLWNAGEGHTCGGFPVGTCPNGYFPVNKGSWHICYKYAGKVYV